MPQFDVLSSHVVEAVIIVIVTILVLFWLRPKPDTTRVEEHEQVSVQIVRDTISCDRVINKFIRNAKGNYNSFIVGLDAEWTPAMQQFDKKAYKIGLLQLATDKHIILIRLNKMNYLIPDALKLLLQNSNILKCGVGIHDDASKIYRDFDIKTVGIIELNDIYACYDSSSEGRKGLKQLYQLSHGKSMKYKKKAITLSHWNTFKDLSMEQIHYAADDALVACNIFIKIMNNIHGLIDCNEYIEQCKNFIDALPLKKKEKKQKTQNDIQSIKKQNIANRLKAERVKRKQNEYKQAVRYKILKLDGSILFYCGKFRFEWFLMNNLADSIDDRSCKLTFDDDDDYEGNESNAEVSCDNICFVCGIQGNDENKIEINRFNIFDDCYWKCLKSEEIQQKCLYGNMIPLCHKSENNCLSKAKQLKIYYISYFCNKYPKITVHPQLLKNIPKYKKAQNAANALHKSHLTIPFKRKLELVKDVAGYFNLVYHPNIDMDEKIHYEEILNITDYKIDINRDSEQKSDNLSSKQIFKFCMREVLKDDKEQIQLHAQELLNEYKKNEIEFIEMWRKNFADTMKPQFVPSYWPLKNMQK